MTNDIQEMHFDSILLDFSANSIKQVHKKLSEHVAHLIGTPEKILFESLMEQEREQSSAIGNGLAIAHMRLPRLTRPIIVFAKLNVAVDFKAADNIPTDMVCLVLSPEFEGPKHLQRLAMTARFFANENTCEKLRETKDKDEVRIVLKNINALRMAA